MDIQVGDTVALRDFPKLQGEIMKLYETPPQPPWAMVKWGWRDYDGHYLYELKRVEGEAHE